MKPVFVFAFLSISLSVNAQNRFEKAIVIEINKFRMENALDTLVWSADLSLASDHHARWMSVTDKISHEETSHVKGLQALTNLEDRFVAYNCTGAGKKGLCAFNENIGMAIDYATPTEAARSVVAGWKLSPRHRANLLFNKNLEYTEYDAQRAATVIGISVRDSKKTPNRWIVMNIGVQLK
jgi:uncharacterized protein YkwD